MNFLTFESVGDDESAHSTPHVNGAHKQQKGMKQGLLTRHFRLPVLVLIALAAVLPTQLFAQTGTTIVFSKNTAHGLYGPEADNATKDDQWFAILRHDITHVQIQSTNTPKLNSNGSGAFAENKNDMLFNSEGELKVTNFYDTSKSGATFQQVCLAVIAPKGYRFTRYQWEVDKATLTSNSSSAVNTCSLCEFTFDKDGKVSPKADSLTITQSLDKWDVTLANGSNVLYFRLSTGVAQQVDVFIKTLKLTYVIDQPFANQLPNSNQTSTFHSGLLDFGEFSTKTSSKNSETVYNVYQNNNLTDLQEVSLYSKSTDEGSTVSKVTDPKVVTVDGNQYYVAAQNGDYYMEAPAKFRIIGATLNFLYNSDASQTKTTATDVTSITSGNAYVITDGNGNYLNNNSGSISNGTDLATATQWTITSSGDGYTIKSGNDYLYAKQGDRGSRTLDLTSSSSDAVWTYSNGFSYKGKSNTYSLQYSNSKWSLSSSSTTTNATKLQTVTTETITAGGSFNATAYAADGSNVQETKNLTTAGTKETVTLTGLNNDAIHFSISGLADGASALYNVSLQLLPLNPELQNLSVATQHNSDDLYGATAFTAENYEFNGGNEVMIVVPESEKGEQHTLTFLDAYNENRTQWYTTGKNESAGTADYSNYFLVNSAADDGKNDAVSLNVNSIIYPSDRNKATQAGTVELLATNIDKVYSGEATTLQDNVFSKTKADYKEATVTPDASEASTYYIYTADVPTYNILPNGTGTKHIDYRYYTLKVICKSSDESAVAEIVPLYTATLKGKNNKNTGILADKSETLDGSTKFYGVKVTAKASTEGAPAKGILSSEQVVTAVKAAVKEKYSIDSLRGMLYLDLSSLTTVDYDNFDEAFHNSTADNCLYFMYPGFHRSNITNAIAKESAESEVYKAVSNIVVKDQQPFFTPYDFTTGTYSASYERESTNGKAKVKNMAVVLPFSISLDDNGHVKTASDATDNTITYYNLTSQGDLKNRNEDSDGLTYGAKMTAISGTAEANKPYYVQKSENAEAGFSYTITDAKFVATPALSETDNSENLTNQASTDAWKAVGTYAGVTPENANNKWYFAKEMLWKSGALKASKKFNVLPFRAYFVGEAATAEVKQAKIVFNDDDIVTNGISNVNAENNGLTIAAANGAIMISAAANTRYAVYTAAGQMVACGTLAAGESRTVKAQPGLYIVNNVKTIVK